jgi:hypothetical protein
MHTYTFVLALWGLLAAQDTQRSSRDAAVELAKATLIKEAATTADSAEVVGVTDAVWRDSSLGCPQRGMMYTPVITSGYRVTLSVKGARYVVHVGQGHAVVCQRPAGSQARLPPPGQGSEGSRGAKTEPATALAGLKLAEQARTDLAKKLSLDKGQITINFFRPTTWPDASLGCPAEGQVYTQQVVKGFRIELAAGGKTYEYHSDMNRIVPCDSPQR